MPDKLTEQEINTLMNALDALEEKASRDGLLNAVMGAMLCRSKEEAQAHMESSRLEMKMSTDPKQKETLVLIRAKLIGLRSGK